MKPSSSNRVRSYTRPAFLTAAAILLAGLALWYFSPAPASPQAAPLAQTKPASPRDEPFVAQQTPSEAGRPAPTAPVFQTTAPVRTELPVQVLAASPAITSSTESNAPLAAATPAPHAAELSVAETAATARMYAAHSSLRTPEVADPDSKSNKQVLQTMVLKALAQGPTQPAGQQVTSPR